MDFRIIVIILIFSISFLSATIWEIKQDGTGHFVTIQEGIDAAVSGDTVLVYTGTYYELINFDNKDITIASLFLISQDEQFISQTIINGNQNGSVVTFENGESNLARLTGFTITNGSSIEGGGIYVANNSSPQLDNLIISDNEASHGGGVHFDNCDNTGISNSIIHNNSLSDYGGGISIFECDYITIENVVFDYNLSGLGGNISARYSSVLFKNTKIISGNAFAYGAGVYCVNSELNFENVRISGNSASFGAGIYASSNSNISIINSLVMNNVSESGAAIKGTSTDCKIINSIFAGNGGFQGGIIDFGSDDELYAINSLFVNNTAQIPGGHLFLGFDFLFNSVIWHNTELLLGEGTIIHYSVIQDGWQGTGIGNIYSDPLFVNPDEGDYYIQDSSPCIGAGIDMIEIEETLYYAPEFDIEGNPRPQPTGSMPDIGAYEHPLGEPQIGVDHDQLPEFVGELSNYPNPFNPETTIEFSLNQSGLVTIEIYNIRGQKVRTLINSEYAAGQHSIVWDGRNERGREVSGGVYLYQLSSGEHIETRKMLLLK